MNNSSIVLIAIVAVMIALLIVFGVLNSKKRKKQEKDAQDLINAVKPGNKVKTIGGICGIVVEVDEEENTFVLETGTEQSGKSYIKFDRQAIYQTDAVVPTAVPEEKEEEPAKDGENAEVAEAPAEVDDKPVEKEEKAEEEKPAEVAEKPHRGKKKGAKAPAEQKVEEPFDDVKEQN